MAAAPFDWPDYLTLARTLSTGPDEASQRSSISRAYYYAFHVANDRAKALGYISPGFSEHGALWTHYQSRTDLRCKKIGAIGFRMKKRRVDADYKKPVPGILITMNDQLAQVSDFATRIQQLPATLPNP